MKVIKYLGIILVLLAVLVMVVKPDYVTANNLDELRNDRENNTAKLKEIQAQIKKLNSEKKTTAVEIQLYDLELEKLRAEAEGLQIQIEAQANKIEESRLAIEDKINKIDENNTLLEQRLRAAYKRGDVGYLQIILNSENILDALTRVDTIQLIVQEDVKLLEEIKEQKSGLEDLKKLQEEEKAGMENSKVALDNKYNEIEKMQGQKAAYIDQLSTDIEKMKEEEARREKENAELTEQINKALLDMAYAGGNMMWPVPEYTRITSPFGSRIHPLTGVWHNHRGIDISVPSYTEVHAANDGIVQIATSHWSYGNYVVIDHGGKISTLYAHNNKLLVRKGDKVVKGQVIALSGSTGESTGPHVHFEVRESGVVVDPLKYVGYYLELR